MASMVYPVEALSIAGLVLSPCVSGAAYFGLHHRTRRRAVLAPRSDCLTDALTGLPNRQALSNWMDKNLSARRQHVGRIALFMIDLDRFKEINDERGHSTGDEILRVLGRRLRHSVDAKRGEFIAHAGGDKFFAFCSFSNHRIVPDFLARLRRALSRPVRLQGGRVTVRANFGVAFWADGVPSGETLLVRAELAMNCARNSGQQDICYYDPAMDQVIRHRLNIVDELRYAVARQQFSLCYQAQKRISDKKIVGFEALLRWEHPMLGAVSPVVFIPVAEESGLIQEVGEWVLRTACHAASQWEQPYRISVNVSAEQFHHHDLPGLVRDVLETTGLSPSRLELELTETAIFTDMARATAILNELKAMGVSIAVDDYGTGHSSLGLIRDIVFDRIKLDKLFVQNALGNETDKAIIRAVIFLGRSLQTTVLAEGVETEEQFAFLADEGCDEIQGFLLSRPLPHDLLVATGKVSLIAE